MKTAVSHKPGDIFLTDIFPTGRTAIDWGKLQGEALNPNDADVIDAIREMTVGRGADG